MATISSALLLLLDMTGALLSPRAPPTPAASTGAGDGGDVDFLFFPFLVLYKSGRVVRFMGTDTVQASMDPATGVASMDEDIDADAGLAVRLYMPNLANITAGKLSGKLPLVVFYHGGALVTESAFSPTYQRYLNALVSKAGVLSVSVEYHLAPEHPLPRGYDDAWAALQWALENARSGPEPWLSRHDDQTRLFLVGDSAGGNIAHNMAMRAGREELHGGATIRGMALLDPYFWGKRPVPSETRDPEARRWRDRTWSFVCAGRYEVDDPVAIARAGDRGGAGRAEREGPRLRRGDQGERLGPQGGVVRDARREPCLLPHRAGQREGGEGDGGCGRIHQWSSSDHSFKNGCLGIFGKAQFVQILNSYLSETQALQNRTLKLASCLYRFRFDRFSRIRASHAGATVQHEFCVRKNENFYCQYG